MRTMHPDIKISVLSKALFSEDEEKILGTITSVSQQLKDMCFTLVIKQIFFFAKN